MYLLYFDHNGDSYNRKWMHKIKFFTHAILRTISIYVRVKVPTSGDAPVEKTSAQ